MIGSEQISQRGVAVAVGVGREGTGSAWAVDLVPTIERYREEKSFFGRSGAGKVAARVGEDERTKAMGLRGGW